jgi:small subunit ribosomal protein S16
MALRIRLSRQGAKKRPFYHIVVAEQTSPRDGSFIEKVGTFNPMLQKTDEKRIVWNMERTKYWLGVGAQPSDRVARFLGEAKVIPMPKWNESPKKSAPKAKAQERLKALEAANEAPAAAPAPAPEAAAETPAA